MRIKHAGQLVGLHSVSAHLWTRSGPVRLPRKAANVSRYHSQGKHKNLCKPYIRTRKARRV
jgi:predicted site-specific integrase-resolvase